MHRYVPAVAVLLAAGPVFAQGDVCGGLDLSDGALADCRRQLGEAHTDADRDRALNTYRTRVTPLYAAPTGHPRAPARFMAGVRRESGCEQWTLPPADLAKCLAEMKGARTDEARARILGRYQAIAADTREKPAP